MFGNFLNTIKNIVYPNICIACYGNINRKNRIICHSCEGKIRFNKPPFCQKCGVTLKNAEINGFVCSNCRKGKFYFDRLWCACYYEGVIKELIHSFKYKHKLRLAEFFGNILIRFIDNFNLPIEKCDYLIPVPLNAVRLREREYNQSQLLANEIAKNKNIEVLADSIIRTRNTPAQMNLSKSQRAKNIRGAFKITDPKVFLAKKVVVIDDVITTTATVSEISFLLRKSGAKNIYLLSLARAFIS